MCSIDDSGSARPTTARAACSPTWPCSTGMSFASPVVPDVEKYVNVADATGFRSVRRFRDFFSRHRGEAPSRYRKRGVIRD